MAMEWLPAATRDPRGRTLNWSERTDPKGCLHTTESSGWPGYDGWTVHPHATIMPKQGVGVTIRQNVPFSRASFSLRNLAGGVATNTDFTFQFELVGTCERSGPGYYWPDAEDVVLKDLYHKLIKPLSDAYVIPLKALPFQSYPASYGAKGNTNTVRLSGPAFDTYSGWLGHQHVPENSHGDPGAFPWARMMKLVAPKPVPPKPVEDIMASKEDLEILLENFFRNKHLIPNKPLSPDDPPTPDFTLVSYFSNGDFKIDQFGKTMAALAAAERDRYAALNAKLNEQAKAIADLAKAVAALKPPTPTVPASRPPTP